MSSWVEKFNTLSNRVDELRRQVAQYRAAGDEQLAADAAEDLRSLRDYHRFLESSTEGVPSFALGPHILKLYSTAMQIAFDFNRMTTTCVVSNGLAKNPIER